MARPRPPLAADVRPAPRRLCPVQLKPQCKHCRLARRGGALLRAGSRGTPRGSAGDSGPVKGPAGVAGAAGAATGVANQAPSCGAGTGSGGPPPAAGLPPAQPTRMVRLGAQYPAPGTDPPPPPGIQRAPRWGGGGRPVRAENPSGSGVIGPGGQLHRPPSLPPALAPPVAALPSMAELGAARPMSDGFSVISCALTVSRAPPGSLPPQPHRAGEGGKGGGQAAQWGRHPPPLLPSPSPPQEAAEVQPARDAGVGAWVPNGAAPQATGSSDPWPPLPPPAQRAGTRRVGQRRPMQTLRDAHRAPAWKWCGGHQGVWHCCSRHHEGHP